jgi:hypothetical protein
MRKNSAIAVIALSAAAITAGSAYAVVAGTKGALPSRTSSDVATLIKRESTVIADLKKFQRLSSRTKVASWEKTYSAAVAAQAAAVSRVSSDIAPPVSVTNLTVLNISGSGAQSTANFTIPSRAGGWRVVWSYDCTSFGSAGNFDYYVNKVSGFTLDFGPNQLGTSGSGTEIYHDTGTFNLQVNSECSWTVQAITGP